MGKDLSTSREAGPVTSALQNLLLTNSREKSTASAQEPYIHLALQIAHNLKFQHNWTDLRLHDEASQNANGTLSRPVLSGLPPQRLYVHPDEQIDLLQRQKNEGKTGMPELEREREWVLPSHLREKWSLKRFAAVLDALDAVPGENDGEALFGEADQPGLEGDVEDVEGEGDTLVKHTEPNLWRVSQPKRILLATLDDDSTVVYYIMHDGIVKPRQN